MLEVHRANLMFQPGVIGAGIGADRTDNEAAIVIYVNKESGQRPILPNDPEGIPVTVILTDPFIAFWARLGHGFHKFVAHLHFSIYDQGQIVLGYGPSLTTQQRQMRGSTHTNQ